MFDIKLFVLCAAVFLDASTVTVTAQLEPAPGDVWSDLQVREQAPGAVDDTINLPSDPAVNPFAEQEMEPLVQETRHRGDHSADHSRSRDRDDSDWRNGRWRGGGRRPGQGRGQPKQRDLGDGEKLAVGDPAPDPQQEQLMQEERHWGDHSADHSRSRDRDDSDWRNGRWRGGDRRPGQGRGQPKQRDLGDEMTEKLEVGDPVPDPQQEQVIQEERHWGDHSADHSRSRDRDDSDWRNGRWRGGGNGAGRRPGQGRGQPRQRDLTGETADNVAQNSEVQQLVDEPDDKIVPVGDDVQSRDARLISFLLNNCKRCSDWYEEDKRDTAWLTKLNAEIRCPCSTKVGLLGHSAADQAESKWERDGACLRFGLPLCWMFHPGADGCLRSKCSTETDARQQCCYNDAGKLLRPGTRAAGTPDKASDFSKHKEVDVEPYHWCCRQCSRRGYCDKYLELRKGSDAHCRS